MTKGKGFGIREIKRITITENDSSPVAITDSTEGNEEEKKVLGEITKQKVEDRETTLDKPEIATPVFDEAKILDLVTNAVNVAIESNNKKKDEEFEAAKKALEATYAKEKEELHQQLESTQQENKKLQETSNKIEDLMKLTGAARPRPGFPNVNTQTTHDSDKFDGQFGELIQIYESIPKYVKVTEAGGEFQDFDKTEIDQYVRQFGQPSPQNKLLMSLTKWGRKQGWFQGRGAVPVTQAATTATDLPGGFLPTLSSFARITHRPGHIFWQFPVTEFDFNAGMGTDIQIARFAYLTSSTTLTDYQLSGVGTYADLVTTGDNLQSGVVTVTVDEWGRGKVGATTAMSPVRIPSMVLFLSAYNLLMYLDRNLAQDYARFEDRKIRSLWTPTSRIVYNDGGEVQTTAASVGSGDNGTMTTQFCDSMVAYGMMNLIEPFADGRYGMVHNPYSAKQFKRSLDNRWEAPSEAQLRELTNILNPTVIPPQDFSRVSGYMGEYNNIHHFVTNAFGTGAAGTEGVQNVTLGTGSTLTRSSYFFGAYSIGRGVAMPFEIRESEITNYNRKRDFTWISQEGFVAMDVDPTGYSDSSAVPQQLRVIQVRTVDTAL